MSPPIAAIAGATGTALDLFDKFISVAKEVAKLPELVLPQYAEAAEDLYKISQKLLDANESMARWLNRFLYFDFRQADSRTKFLDLVRDYRTMKQGPEFRRLKFSCSDIRAIYYKNVSSKLGIWLTNKANLQQAQHIFEALCNADQDLVAFTYGEIVKALDSAVDEMETHVQNQSIEDAERRRLEAKAGMKELTERLESYGGALADLVLSFAGIAHKPITL